MHKHSSASQGWRYRVKSSVLEAGEFDARTGSPEPIIQKGEVILRPGSNHALRLWYPAPGNHVWTIEHLQCRNPPHGRLELVKSVSFYGTQASAHARLAYWQREVFGN